MQFSRMLEAGLQLQKLGHSKVGVATAELERRRRALTKRLEEERSNFDRKMKLRSR